MRLSLDPWGETRLTSSAFQAGDAALSPDNLNLLSGGSEKAPLCLSSETPSLRGRIFGV